MISEELLQKNNRAAAPPGVCGLTRRVGRLGQEAVRIAFIFCCVVLCCIVLSYYCVWYYCILYYVLSEYHPPRFPPLDCCCNHSFIYLLVIALCFGAVLVGLTRTNHYIQPITVI